MPSTADQVDTAGRRSGLRADLTAVAAAALLVIAAAAVGRLLLAQGVDLLLPFPPLLAQWLPHAVPAPRSPSRGGRGRGVGTADRAALPWPPCSLTAWVAAAVGRSHWPWSTGWQRGVVERLSSGEEYLHDVPRVDDVAGVLATFADHVLTNQPEHWTTHVGAHPPGVLLFYVALDRLGLGGGGPAGVVTVLVGASACVAVAVALRALGAEDVARRALPFGVLLPGAVWVGVSADGMFAAVLAWGVALFAIGAEGRGARADAAALAGGVLLGATLYLSYGLVLGLLLPAAVVAVTRRWRAAAWAAAGAAAVFAAFTASGFWWFTGFAHVRVIYAASIAASRPYSYFVWANLAAVSLAVGPAVWAGARRAAAAPRRASGRGRAARARGAGRDRRRRPHRAVEGRGRADLVTVRGVARGAVRAAAPPTRVAGRAGRAGAGRQPPAADGLVSRRTP